MTVSQIEKYLENKPYTIAHTGGTVEEQWNTGNDNLAFDGEGNLWVLQDGGRDYIWMARTGHTPANPQVELFATTPVGAEPCGITFTPDYKYMFLSFQNPAGTNEASITDAAGKEITFNASTTVVVARKEYLGAGAVKPMVELGKDTVICAGDILVLDAGASPDVLTVWNDNSNGRTLEVSASGRYYVTLIGNNRQQATDSVNIVVSPLPTPELGDDLVICSSCDVTLDAGTGYTSYLWNTGQTTQMITVSSAGTYTVTVTDANNCQGVDELKVDVATGIAGMHNQYYSIDAAPNPFPEGTGILLTLRQNSEVLLEVFDMAGRKVTTLANAVMNSGEYRFDFNPSDYGYPTGMFILKSTIEGKVANVRLIKQ